VVSDSSGVEASRGHYAGGTTFHIARLRMVANTGTYLDAPFHRVRRRQGRRRAALASLADLDGVVVSAPEGERPIDADRFAGRDLAGKAVLVRTGGTRTGARRATRRGTRI